MRFSSLRSRLLLLVLLCVIPAFALIAYSGFEHRRFQENDALQDANRLARIVTVQNAVLITDSRLLLAMLADVPELRVGGSIDACHRSLKKMLSLHSDYANLAVIRQNGDLFCAALPPKNPTNASGQDYFHKALTTKSFSVGYQASGETAGKVMLIASYPRLDAEGKIAAVLTVSINLSWLDRTLNAAGLPEGTVLTVVDHRGMVIANCPSGGGWVGQSLLKDGGDFNKALMDGTRTVRAALSHDGVQRIFSFVPIGGAHSSDVYVGVGIPLSVTVAAEDRALARNLLMMSVAALFVIALAWFGGDALVLRRLRAMAQAARRLAAGDLGARTGLRQDASELGQLGHAFDDMAQSLEHRIREVQRVARALKTLSAGNHALLHATEENALLREVCRIVVEEGGQRMAWVGYAEHDPQKTVRPVAQAGIGSDFVVGLPVTWSETAFGLGPTGIAIRSQRPSLSSTIPNIDPNLAPWREKLIGYGFTSILALPLKTNGETIGNLTIYSAEPDAFGEQEVALFEELADDLGFGIGTLWLRAVHARSAAEIEHLAYHDRLTDLPNRAWLYQRLEQLIVTEQKQRAPFTLLHLDIEHYRDVNEALGHQQGDALLRLIGPRLSESVGDSGTVARIGSDEFAVVLPAADADAAVGYCEQIISAFARPFELSDLAVELQASIGIALYPGHGDDADSLMRRADMAVRAAKKSGTEFAFPAQDSEQGMVRRFTLTRDLRRAIENDELVLYCQPKLDIASGTICSAEMLARWNHSELGAISPTEFVAIAERTGLIKPLTYWVVKEATRHLHDFEQAGLDLPLAVNLSVRNLHDPKLTERITGLCTTWGVTPARLQLEITESAIMEDHDGARDVLVRLHDLGFELHIDDFGTGYSSLAYLQSLPVDAIKVDQSFVRKMRINEDSRTIARSTIDLAHNLGLKAIAEGVEDQPTLNLLAEMGCDMAQGFYIARPMPVRDFYEWYDTRHKGAHDDTGVGDRTPDAPPR